MKIKNLHEDAKNDKSVLNISDNILSKLVSELETNSFNNAETITINGTKGKSFKLSDFNHEVSDKYGELRIVFIRPLTVNQEYALGAYSNINRLLIIFIDPFEEVGLRVDEREDWKEAFIHEFTHFIDYQRFKGDVTNKTSQFDQDYTDYINNPVEFNAHFQQSLYNFEELLKRLKTNHSRNFDKLSQSLFPNKEKFISFVLNRTGLSKTLNDSYLRKAKKRLSKYYDEHREEIYKTD